MAVKYFSDPQYSDSLQAAFDDLHEGDILYLDKSCELNDTVRLSQRNVQIIGAEGLESGGAEATYTIRPKSDGVASPLIQIINQSPAVPSLTNIILSRVRLRNAEGMGEGSGTGTAIQIVNDPASGGAIWHLKFEDVDIENFEIGLNIQDAFDIVISNCQISGCKEEMVFDSTDLRMVPGQIKLINGFCVKNNTHIKVKGATGATFDKILGFGWSCGHERGNIPVKATAISSSIAMNGIILFGCHLEDLEYGIEVSSYIGMIDVQGCTFASINV
jgi:hypothetical protein